MSMFFRGGALLRISNMLCFVGVGTMVPIAENKPVKTIKTAFLITRAKSTNIPVYCEVIYEMFQSIV